MAQSKISAKFALNTTSHASRRTAHPGRSSIFMDYTKRPLTLQEQVDKLRNRGLLIDDEQLAKEYLSNISYYRLRAYTYPFQDNVNPIADHKFLRDDIHFSDIIDLYRFDRRLRSVMFNAIEKIEVAVRTKIVQAYAETTGDTHWFSDRNLYKHQAKRDRNGNLTTAFDLLMKDIENEVKRSNEDFIKHYFSKYDNPPMPPAWMTLEVLSLGTLSRLYQLLKKSPIKKKIAKEFGLNDDRILANWLHAIAVWRNCCAHHSRIWNRRSIISVQMPTNADNPFIDNASIRAIRPNKIFAALCCIKYISNIISPDSDIKRNILSIIGYGGNLLNLHEMGFPRNWKTLDVWK